MAVWLSVCDILPKYFNLLKKAAYLCGFYILFVKPLVGSQPQVLSENLNIVPNQAGTIRMGSVTWYYASAGHSIEILDERFKLRRSIYVPSDVAGYEFADLDGDGYDDLIELSQQAVFVRAARQNVVFAERRLLLSGAFALPPFANDIESLTLAADFDGDGRLDLFLPKANGTYGMYLQGEDGFTMLKQFPYRLQGSFSDRVWKNSDVRGNSLRSVTTLPRAYFRDLNNDGLPDVYFRVESSLHYLRSNPDVSMPGLSRALALQKIVVYPVSLDEIYASLAEITDLDSDGHPDLIFSVVKGLGLNIRTEISIFWGNDGLPSANLKTFHNQAGAFFPPLVLNLKDKRALLVPVIQPGVAFFASYVVRSKVTVTALFFKLADRELTEVSSYEVTFSALGTLFPGFNTGDFDGDGITDFVFGRNLQELQVFRGNEKFNAHEMARFNLPSYGILKKVPRSTHDDLLLYLPQDIRSYDRSKIFLIKFR